MSDVSGSKKRKRDDDGDVSQAETVPIVKKTALPEAAPVDLMGWGPKYIKEEELHRYAKKRDEEQQARLEEQKAQLELEHTLRKKAYNDIKDNAFREQTEPLKKYIQELKAENDALRQKQCRCVD